MTSHPDPARFSAALRDATWPYHRQAEQTEYLRALVSGRVDRLGYAAMVAQHWFAYLVLEEAARTMRVNPIAAPFISDELERVPALEQDLYALLGPEWRDTVAANGATRRYCERMRAVCFAWPGAFIAHHYTRYLGDLSGGQFLARAVRRQLGLGHGTGTAFYDFSALGDLDAFKERYRRRLDAVDWPDDERERVIAETAYAYHLNTEVLVELAPLVNDPDVAPAA
jgi:heme oxygenase (biliverdin-producing, ferredoxin)